MFIAMSLMLLGVLLGRLLRGQRWIGAPSRCIAPAIMLLLFSLGVAVIRRWFRDFPPAPDAGKRPQTSVEAQPPHGGQ